MYTFFQSFQNVVVLTADPEWIECWNADGLYRYAKNSRETKTTTGIVIHSQQLILLMTDTYHTVSTTALVLLRKTWQSLCCIADEIKKNKNKNKKLRIK